MNFAKQNRNDFNNIQSSPTRQNGSKPDGRAKRRKSEKLKRQLQKRFAQVIRITENAEMPTATCPLSTHLVPCIRFSAPLLRRRWASYLFGTPRTLLPSSSSSSESDPRFLFGRYLSRGPRGNGSGVKRSMFWGGKSTVSNGPVSLVQCPSILRQ